MLDEQSGKCIRDNEFDLCDKYEGNSTGANNGNNNTSNNKKGKCKKCRKYYSLNIINNQC